MLALNLGLPNVDKMLNDITLRQWNEWNYIMHKHSYMFDGGNMLTANTIANMHSMMGNKCKVQDFILELKKPKVQSEDEIMQAVGAL